MISRTVSISSAQRDATPTSYFAGKCSRFYAIINEHCDGLMRKLRNSKFGQGWNFWFVDDNSDSPLSSLELCGLKKREFSFLIKIITDLGLFRRWRITVATHKPKTSTLTKFGVTEFSH